jgi:hypothetical protein
MSEARDLVFFYNGVELTDESVENVPAELDLPIKGGTMRRGGKVWTVVEVRKTGAPSTAGKQILQDCFKEKLLEEVYSSVVIPALSLAEQDRHRHELDDETQTFIYLSTREPVEQLANNAIEKSSESETLNPPETPDAMPEANVETLSSWFVQHFPMSRTTVLHAI